MSVTAQKEMSAFYDYCLCVSPLKAEWGGTVRGVFLAAQTSAVGGVQGSMPTLRGPGSYHAIARLKRKSEGLFAFRNTKPCLSGL